MHRKQSVWLGLDVESEAKQKVIPYFLIPYFLQHEALLKGRVFCLVPAILCYALLLYNFNKARSLVTAPRLCSRGLGMLLLPKVAAVPSPKSSKFHWFDLHSLYTASVSLLLSQRKQAKRPWSGSTCFERCETWLKCCKTNRQKRGKAETLPHHPTTENDDDDDESILQGNLWGFVESS